MPSSPSNCPFCGQPLTNQAAIDHLHRSESKFEADLRRVLQAEANAAADKKLKEERKSVQAKLEKTIRAELEKKQATKERHLEGTVKRLRDQNDELERRLEDMNAPERGDLREEEIFNRLVEAFPDDDIKREGKGGDIMHVVRYSAGKSQRRAGLILYECKDTLRWLNSFIEQIKADGKTHRTRHLLLVTRAMPKGEDGMFIRDDVAVVGPDYVIYLAHVLRQMVIEADRAGLAGQGKAAKTSQLYEYLAGDEFREHFGAVVKAGGNLTSMLQEEKRAHERTWTRREQAYSELERKAIAVDEAICGIIEAEPPPKKSGARRPSANGRHQDKRRKAAHRTSV